MVYNETLLGLVVFLKPEKGTSGGHPAQIPVGVMTACFVQSGLENRVNKHDASLKTRSLMIWKVNKEIDLQLYNKY